MIVNLRSDTNTRACMIMRPNGERTCGYFRTLKTIPKFGMLRTGEFCSDEAAKVSWSLRHTFGHIIISSPVKTVQRNFQLCALARVRNANNYRQIGYFQGTPPLCHELVIPWFSPLFGFSGFGSSPNSSWNELLATLTSSKGNNNPVVQQEWCAAFGLLNPLHWLCLAATSSGNE